MMIDVPTKRNVPMIQSQATDHILYGGRFSPDSRWVAFTASMDKCLRLFISTVHDWHGLAEGSWIPVSIGASTDQDVAWSPDGNLLYFLSKRDGFRCIWAQRLEPETKRPAGTAFAVQHFHHPRQSLDRVGSGTLTGMSVAQGRLVVALSDLTGEIWMEERHTPGAGWLLRWMPSISR